MKSARAKDLFLELPQSINATQDKAENKIAQAWWRIAGYTTVNKDELFKSELLELNGKIGQIGNDLANNKQLTITFTQSWLDLNAQLKELCEAQAEREKEIADAKKLTADKKTKELCEKLLHDLEQTKKAIEDTRGALQSIDDQKFKLQKERARLSQTFTALSTKYEKLRIEQIKRRVREQQDAADRLLQGGGANTSEIVKSTVELLRPQTIISDKGTSPPPVRQLITLDQVSITATTKSDDATLRNTHLVRTIDIIPRQNAVNVNDTKERVSKTGIFAAVSFLFGFAGKFTYERQHEQAEQFLNQELFTSGFGKGEADFGWNFYPFAGARQLASGIRTTYAIVVIPKDAESLILRAQGCYFPRKDNQPFDYDMAARGGWTKEGEKVAACTPQEQEFILPVPGGSGDGSDFYITEMRYSAHRKASERMVASIYGQNLPSQIGVLINGVALTRSVGLAQTGVESILGDKVKENCVGQICGRFERIDSNQLVVSFNMPPDFTGFPRISLVGPGKAIEINRLHLNINGDDDTQLDSSEYMFGKQPNEASRSIADFKVAPATTPNQMTGVLSGGKFKATDTIYVNGVEAKISGSPCKRPDLCLLTFRAQETDFLTVTVSPADNEEEAVSRTFVNPTTLSVISASIVSSEEDATHTTVLTVRLDGSGFKNTLNVRFDNTGTLKKKTVTAPGQMVLEITNPSPMVSITLQDSANNKSVSTVVVLPPPKAKEK